AAAEEKAKELIKKLDDGADFADLAKKNSDDTGSAENGGALNGAFTKEGSNYVQEFTDAAFALEKVGAYSKEPVKSSYGYHIIKIDDMTSDDNMDDVLQGIIDDDLASQRSEKLTSYMDEFEADAVIVYYDENGKEVKKEEEADAEGDDSKQDKAADSESTDGDATEDTAAE
ncbi:MAG: peptidylprolyl isomerase, partial [Bacillota bacterium]|nr:peptidylprolyl isomerase [Bacillota bacterium]